MSIKRRLAAAGSLVRAGQGQVLFREGEPGENMYIVLSGTVAIECERQGRRVELARLGPGSFFGEMSLLEGLPRSATATVVEDADLLVVDRENFEPVLAAEPSLAVRMLKTLSGRVRKLDRKVAQIEAFEGLVAGEWGPAEVQESDGGAPPVDGELRRMAAAIRLRQPSDEQFLYDKEVACPACGQRFTVRAVRTARLRTSRIEADLRVRYEGFEPLWYLVWVCPGCLYANLRTEFDAVGERAAQRLQESAAARRRAFAEPPADPSLAAVIDAFRLALLCEEAMGGDPEKQGRLWLALSWIFQDLASSAPADPSGAAAPHGQAPAAPAVAPVEQAQAAVRQARERALAWFTKAYSNSRRVRDELRLAYLIGELHFEAGRLQDAHRFFLKALEAGGSNPWIRRQAADRLQLLRAQVRERRQGPEPPERPGSEHGRGEGGAASPAGGVR